MNDKQAEQAIYHIKAAMTYLNAATAEMQHTLEDGSAVWTRYAHIVTNGDTLPLTVQNGVQIGRIADYTPKGPQGDHLHFDVMLNYKDNPGDWPGMDLARLKLDYTDPVLWLKQRGK